MFVVNSLLSRIGISHISVPGKYIVPKTLRGPLYTQNYVSGKTSGGFKNKLEKKLHSTEKRCS